MSTVTMPELTEVEGKIAAKQKELSEIFAEAGPEYDFSKVKSVTGATDSKGVADYVAGVNDELTDLGTQRDKLLKAKQAAERNLAYNEAGATETGGPDTNGRNRKSIGEHFTESEAFKAYSGGSGPSANIDVDLKTLFERSAGWDPEDIRSGLVVMDAQRPVQVTDLLPQIPSGQSAYKYMEETTFTNNAAEVAEGGTYGEAALALTERSVTIEKVGVWIPVTDEQLEDEPGARAYINARLPFMLAQRVDSQILQGNGSTPNIQGVNGKSGVQTQAKGADPAFDAIHKSYTKIRVTGRAIPTATVYHPNDWQDIRLTRTADGIYILGNPADVGPERLFGVLAVQSDAQTENTATSGDWRNYSLLVARRGIEVKVTDAHSDYFIKGKQAVRADVRLATVWTRPEAFCLTTGL